jgi:hypothetical protein
MGPPTEWWTDGYQGATEGIQLHECIASIMKAAAKRSHGEGLFSSSQKHT